MGKSFSELFREQAEVVAVTEAGRLDRFLMAKAPESEKGMVITDYKVISRFIKDEPVYYSEGEDDLCQYQ